MFLRVILVFCMAILVSRLYQLQFTKNERVQGDNPVEINTTRYIITPPRRGEILSHDEKTRLAESVPLFSIGVRPGNLPPIDSDERQWVLDALAQISGLTSTVVISPASSLQTIPDLHSDLLQISNDTIPRPYHTTISVSLPIAPHQILKALDVTRKYRDILTLDNPIESLIDPANTRNYDLVVIKEHISDEMALAVQENLVYLPGVEIVQQYRRRYPLSARTPSLSHILGYTGRVNACELVVENPALSWINSLADVVSHVGTCGLLSKKIESHMLIDIPPYQNDDRIGKDGLEASYESELRGKIGIDTILVDALERPVGVGRVRQAVQNGYNLVLTIDADFQSQVETILHRWIDEADRRRHHAQDEYKQAYPPIKSGVIVAMDPRDGRVLAMVNLPAYDNNIWGDRSRATELQNLLNPSDPELKKEIARLSPLTNRIITGQYPPGSSLKPFVGAAALQKGVIAPDTRLRDPGKIVLEERDGRIFVLPNSEPKDNGEINISDALMVSSNVFFATIAGGNQQAINLDEHDLRINGLTITGLQDGLHWFRFGNVTGIRLPGEAPGRVPDPVWKSHALREPWTIGDTYNTVIGQGYLEVTPLQLVTAGVAIANDGTMYQPQLVQKIVDSQGATVQEFQAEELSKLPIESQYLSVVREGMRRSVTDGLNVAARDACSGLSIAGKTGTAEFGPMIVKPDGSIARRSHAWFVGFAPYDHPEIVVVALIEGAGDMNDGSSTLAVPAVTQVMQAYFHVSSPNSSSTSCPSLPR